jgi:hypothetical protein
VKAAAFEHPLWDGPAVDRQRTLKLLDAEIEAFSDLIATQCSG